MSVKLLTEHHLEFLSLKGGYTCQMPHCWKLRAMAPLVRVWHFTVCALLLLGQFMRFWYLAHMPVTKA